MKLIGNVPQLLLSLVNHHHEKRGWTSLRRSRRQPAQLSVEQCDGLTLPEISQPAIAPEIDEDDICESIVTEWKNRPALYFNSPTEYRAYTGPLPIPYMPARSRFVDAAHYYSTLFHEIIHSTDHESRLNLGSRCRNLALRYEEHRALTKNPAPTPRDVDRASPL